MAPVLQQAKRARLIDPRKAHRAEATPRAKHICVIEHPKLADRVEFLHYDTNEELHKLMALGGKGPWYKLTYEQALKLDSCDVTDLLAGNVCEIPK